MTYYNTLVADKLKTISEISRINSLIDGNKRDGEDFSILLEQLKELRAQLDLLNAQILGFQLSQDDSSSLSVIDALFQNSSKPFNAPFQNDITGNNSDNSDSSLSVGLPE